jgi:hypothetical protein
MKAKPVMLEIMERKAVVVVVVMLVTAAVEKELGRQSQRLCQLRLLDGTTIYAMIRSALTELAQME